MHIAERWSSRFRLENGVLVYCPSKEMLAYGEAILKKLNTKWVAPDNYFHLKKTGHLGALRVHLGSEYFCALDLANFFGHISSTRITRSLKDLVGYQEAREIARFSTVKNERCNGKDCLPFGFVQSALLASICFYHSRMGVVLSNWHQKPETRVSLYMDDIILSSESKDLLVMALDELEQAAERSRFAIKNQKTQNPSRKITVFNIELTKNKTQLTTDRLDQFRKQVISSSSLSTRQGILSYIKSVDREQFKKIEMEFAV